MCLMIPLLILIFVMISARICRRRFGHGRGGCHRGRHCGHPHPHDHGRSRRRHGHGDEGDDGHGHDDDFGGPRRHHHHREHRGDGGRLGFRSLLDALDLDDDESDVLREGARDMKSAFKNARAGLHRSMDKLMDAFVTDDFDVELTGAALAEERATVEALFEEVISSLGNAHAKLDPDTRRRLVERLRRNRRRFM